jgi:hypothetical protein
MKTLRNLLLTALLSLGATPALAYYDYEEPSTTGPGLAEKFYFSFSLGDGAYFDYYCNYDQGCKTVLAGPADFELLLGVQLVKNFYLDLAAHWGIDYYQGYYSSVTYLTGVRPGVRIFLPLLFNRFLFFRVALPVSYTIDEAKNWVVGLLLGAGVEWRFQNLGLFAEVDVMPYFTELYPGYYLIPATGRLGLSFRF